VESVTKENPKKNLRSYDGARYTRASSTCMAYSAALAMHAEQNKMIVNVNLLMCAQHGLNRVDA
jgi:hypothetical protein